MSITYAHSVEGWISIVGEGTVSMPERADCFRRMLDDVLLPVPSNVLIDVSTVLIAPTVDDVPNIQFMLRLVQGKFKGKINSEYGGWPQHRKLHDRDWNFGLPRSVHNARNTRLVCRITTPWKTSHARTGATMASQQADSETTCRPASGLSPHVESA